MASDTGWWWCMAYVQGPLMPVTNTHTQLILPCAGAFARVLNMKVLWAGGKIRCRCCVGGGCCATLVCVASSPLQSTAYFICICRISIYKYPFVYAVMCRLPDFSHVLFPIQVDMDAGTNSTRPHVHDKPMLILSYCKATSQSGLYQVRNYDSEKSPCLLFYFPPMRNYVTCKWFRHSVAVNKIYRFFSFFFRFTGLCSGIYVCVERDEQILSSDTVIIITYVGIAYRN